MATTTRRLGRDLARGALRALIAGTGFVGLASAADLTTWSVVPPLSAAYFAALVVPCTIVEGWLLRSRLRVSSMGIAATWCVLVACLVFVHFQAAYAGGLVSAASFGGGVDAIWSEVRRLRTPAPGEAGSLVGLDVMDFFSVVVAASGMALMCSVLARPMAGGRSDERGRRARADRARGVGPVPSRPTGCWKALSWLTLFVVGVVLGTPAISLLIELHPIVLLGAAIFLITTAIPTCGVMLAAMTFGDWATRVALGHELERPGHSGRAEVVDRSAMPSPGARREQGDRDGDQRAHADEAPPPGP